MITIIESNGYTIEFNGKSSWFVSNSVDCIGRYNTERKARNELNRAMKAAGVIQ